MDGFSKISRDELMITISYLNIKNIINLSRSSHHFHQIILDEHVYSLGQLNEINVKGLEYSKKFYLKYNRGKSYPDDRFQDNPKFPELGNHDVPFSLSDGEYILYFSDVKLSEYNPGSIIVTINKLLQYTVYQFKQEVNQQIPFAPYYNGWDDADIDITVVEEKRKYSSINEIIVVNFWCMKPALKMIHDSLMIFPDILELSAEQKELRYPDMECDFYR